MKLLTKKKINLYKLVLMIFIMGCDGSSVSSINKNPPILLTQSENTLRNLEDLDGLEHNSVDENEPISSNRKKWNRFYKNLSSEIQQDFILYLAKNDYQVAIIPKTFSLMMKPKGSRWNTVVQENLPDEYLQIKGQGLRLKLRRNASIATENRLIQRIEEEGFESLVKEGWIQSLSIFTDAARVLPITQETFEAGLDCKEYTTYLENVGIVSIPKCTFPMTGLPSNSSTLYMQTLGDTSESKIFQPIPLNTTHPGIFWLNSKKITLYSDIFNPMSNKLKPGGQSMMNNQIKIFLHWNLHLSKDHFINLTINWQKLTSFVTMQLKNSFWQFDDQERKDFFLNLAQYPYSYKGIQWESPVEISWHDRQELAKNIAQNFERWLTPILFSHYLIEGRSLYAARENPELVLSNNLEDRHYPFFVGSSTEYLGTSEILLGCVATNPDNPSNSEFFADYHASDCLVEEYFRVPE